jgi:hypothetical protein
MTHEEKRARGLIYEARYNALHPERRKAATAKWRKAHPERGRAYAAKWAAAHPDMQNARAKRFAVAHPDRIKAAGSRYRKANAKSINVTKAKYRAAHPGWNAAKYQRFRARHPGRLQDIAAKSRKKCVMTTRAGHLKRVYGLTPDTFVALLEAQGFCCAICAKALVNDRTTSVDHNHKTGRVRGLLCRHCNTGIGLLGDSSVRVAVAAEYLRKDEGVAFDSAALGER